MSFALPPPDRCDLADLYIEQPAGPVLVSGIAKEEDLPVSNVRWRVYAALVWCQPVQYLPAFLADSLLNHNTAAGVREAIGRADMISTCRAEPELYATTCRCRIARAWLLCTFCASS